jgi:hypothetical protein
MSKDSAIFFLGAFLGTYFYGRFNISFSACLIIYAGLAAVCAFVRLLVLTERDEFL